MFIKDKIGIITGAGQGIGKAIAIAFAEKGITPVIVDINEKSAQQVVRELKNKGKEALALNVDISNVDEIKNMVRTVVEKYGKVDILVNNAGILHSTTIEDITEQEWDKIMAINLKSVFFASQQVLPYMKKNGYGRIVNISSLAGRMGGYANGLGYTASKAGIIGLTYGMARRVAEMGITVNAVAPGTTESKLIKQFTSEKVKELESIIPIKRLGKPEDIANAVTFLASEEAGFITGAILDVNGGMFTG